jgi:sugar phosphate isomerase/epimerase
MSVSFRIAAFNDEISQDFERVIQVCKDYALPGIELRQTNGKQPHMLTGGEAKALRQRLDDEGLVCCCVSPPFYKCKIDDPDAIAKHHEMLRRCIEHAHVLGASFVRGFTFWRDGAFDEERCKRVVDLYEAPVAILEAMDCRLAMENEAACSVALGRETKAFMLGLNSPRVVSIWDPANCVMCKDKETPFPDGYEDQKPWMGHIHMKDARWNDEEKHMCVCMGEGQVDWTGQFRALRDDGYEGWISMETHWKPTDEEIQARGGLNGLETKEFATRKCLDAVMKMLAQF